MNQERLMDIILAPINSEKSYRVGDKFKQFVFKVRKDSNKLEIAKAIEKLFNVKVKKVTTCNMPSKARNFGQVSGRKSGYKKAYVSLHEGHDINFTVAEGK